MTAIAWNDRVVPVNVPVVLRIGTLARAEIVCGICDHRYAWTTSGGTPRAMTIGDVLAAITVHVDEVHCG